MRKRITPGTVLGLIAVLFCVSGTAFAATKMTGKDIKDGSLTGADVKNGSLSTADLSSRAFNSLRGQNGTNGAKGDTGPSGPKGDQGIPGTAAAKGDKGDKGDTGAKGDKGDKGDIGNPGPQGNAGRSAYQTWLDAGNTGNEAAFLATLKGAKGDKGEKGDTGASGLEGARYAVAYYDVGDTNPGAIATVACDANDATSQEYVAISGGVQTLGLKDNGITRNTPVSNSFPGRMDWSTNTPKSNRLDGWIVQFGGGTDPKHTKVWALCVEKPADVPVVETYTQSAD